MCQLNAAMWAAEREKIAKQSPSQDVALRPVCHVPRFACHSSTRPHQSHQQPHCMSVYVTLPITGKCKSTSYYSSALCLAFDMSCQGGHAAQSDGILGGAQIASLLSHPSSTHFSDSLLTPRFHYFAPPALALLPRGTHQAGCDTTVSPLTYRAP